MDAHPPQNGAIGVWLKIQELGLRRFWSMFFHLPGFHFGTGFLTHSLIGYAAYDVISAASQGPPLFWLGGRHGHDHPGAEFRAYPSWLHRILLLHQTSIEAPRMPLEDLVPIARASMLLRECNREPATNNIQEGARKRQVVCQGKASTGWQRPLLMCAHTESCPPQVSLSALHPASPAQQPSADSRKSEPLLPSV